MRRGVQRGQQLNTAQKDADGRGERALRELTPTPASNARNTPKAAHATAFHHTPCGKPSSSSEARSSAMAANASAGSPALVDDQYVDGSQQPWHVRDDGDHVDVRVVQQLKPLNAKSIAPNSAGARAKRSVA